MKHGTLTKATLGRLPQYLHFLRNTPSAHTLFISATTIAKALSLGEVQVRKDLNAVSGAGRPKTGYETQALIRRLEECLGASGMTPAVLVGAGKMGRALYDYEGFNEFGVDIIAAFDCNTEILNTGNKNKIILPISRFRDICKEHHVQIGIITVGAGSAQSVCDTMVESGIKAIWNFAPYRLEVPDNIIVRQENLALSLAYLNNQISKSIFGGR